jgi:uncharacterized repeat protein (TIGR02543 family)
MPTNIDNFTIADCTTQAAADLAEAKTSAENTVNAVNANDYIAADQQTVTEAKTTALAAIEAATTEAEVTAALNNFNEAIADCTTQAAADLAEAKTSAENTVNAVNANDYIAADQQTVTNAKTTALAAIEAATTEAEVTAALNNFNEAIADCTTQAAADLAEAKTSAENTVNAVNANDYIAADQQTVTNAKTTALAAIEAATTEEEVTTALNNFNEAIADCTTQTAADLAEAKTSAENTVNAVNANDYIAADQQTVTEAKTTALAAIEAATTEAEVTAALNNFNEAIADCTTQAAADLAEAKTNAENTVNAVNANDYIAADQQTVTNAKTTALAAIEAATTEEEVTTALNNFNEAIADCTTQAAADLAEAKTSAENTVNAVNANDYIAADQQTVTNAKTTALAAIEAATTEEEVTTALNNFNEAIADCTTQASADLAEAKTNAENTVNEVNANDYIAADQQTVTDAKTTALEAIEAATTEAEVTAALDDFNEAIADCTTQAAADLAEAKTSAENTVNEVNANDYIAADQQTVTNAKTTALAAIEAATTEEEVTTALNNFNEAIADCTTQASADLAEAKTSAENTVNAVNANDYIAADQQIVTDAKTTALAAIEAATTEAEVTAALDDFNNAIASCTTQVVADQIAQVMSEVSAKTGSDMTYTGNPLQLINTPTTALPAGYTMKYAVTTENTKPTDENLYTTSIPTATDAGSYYVWYKVKGDNNHNDTDAACTTVTISPADNSELTTAINDAKAFYESIEKEYSAIAKELKTALDKAEAVAGSNTSTPENISDATEALDTALNLAKDKVEFEKYKRTKETEAGNLAKTDDSDTCKALITKAQQDIAYATYNTEKTLGENKAAVNTIITDLKSALDTQRAVDKEAADKAAADKVIEAINILPAKEDVTASDKEAVEAARAAYDALTASQKDKIDTATLQKLTDAEEALVALGELDKNVVAFNSEKNVQKAEAVKLAKEDDSDAVRKLIADAREAIDALDYDKNKSLDENKAALAAIITELGNALEEQRELEKILAVVKIDQGETVAEVDKTAIRAEDVETVTNVAKSTAADLSEAATTRVKQIVEESETVEDSDKNIVIVPALDVKGKEYSVTETDATMTLDIEAVYTSYETTSDITTAADVKSATEAEDETEKAKVKEIGSGKLDTEGTPINVKIEVPAAFAEVLGATTETVKASPATIYVKHTHKNKNYEYNASLYCEGSRYFVEFVNPNGFSLFTLSGNSASVASIGDKNYTDLQSAIDDAADGSTIKLTNDNDVSATINTEKTITIDKDNHTGNVDIKAADTLLLTKTDNENGTTTYKTVTKYKVTFDNNGGKGTMPAQEIGGTAALNANAFTKEGYTFDGWNTTSDGSGTAYADKADVTPAADMTLYAQWKENPKPDDKDKTDAEVEAVKTRINALKAADKITTADKADIEAARKAYDVLTADQKKKVPDDVLKKLTDAEAALKAAEAAEKAAKELEAAKKEAQAAMNEQVTVTPKGNKFTVKWKKASSADGYYVYAQYCGKKATKPAKTVKKNTTTKVTINKINGKKISTKKIFHVYVVPYKIIDGKKVKLAKSTVAHLVGAKSTKYSNVKKLTLKKTKYTVKVGKTAKIKAKITLVNKNKKHIPEGHGAKFRYKSSDTGIATVDKNGKIKGIKKGKCTIYVYSINGLTKKAKITVK